jgi:hypothetical protein
MATPCDTVTERLFGGLERRTLARRATCELPVAEALAARALQGVLGLSDGSAGVVLVHSLHAGDVAPLRGGDAVSLSPPPGGG